jgi:hypothetical protein
VLGGLCANESESEALIHPGATTPPGQSITVAVP